VTTVMIVRGGSFGRPLSETGGAPRQVASIPTPACEPHLTTSVGSMTLTMTSGTPHHGGAARGGDEVLPAIVVPRFRRTGSKGPSDAGVRPCRPVPFGVTMNGVGMPSLDALAVNPPTDGRQELFRPAAVSLGEAGVRFPRRHENALSGCRP
jgi:hypothetical protein